MVTGMRSKERTMGGVILSWLVALFLLLNSTSLPTGPDQGVVAGYGPGDICSVHLDNAPADPEGEAEAHPHGCCLGLCQQFSAALPASAFVLPLPAQDAVAGLGAQAVVRHSRHGAQANQPRAPPAILV
jgi:hypothetical protein